MLFDDEAASLLERAYATTDMVLQREASRKSLRASSGEFILDLGSGPGFLACEIAEEVGETGRVFAVDISSDMNSISARRAAAAGLSDRIEISEGDATALTFPDSAFDAAVSTQVIEYLADPDAALVELARVLRPGGRLVLIDTDFDSLVWAATDRDLAARIAAAWDEHLPDPHLPCSLLPRLRAAGFAIRRSPNRADSQHGIRPDDLQLQPGCSDRVIRPWSPRHLRKRRDGLAERPCRPPAAGAVLLQPQSIPLRSIALVATVRPR